jgi:hypothetical protein
MLPAPRRENRLARSQSHRLADQAFTDTATLDHAIKKTVHNLNLERFLVSLAKLRVSA